MDILLKIEERMLMELLKVAISGVRANDTCFEKRTMSEWQKCYQLAKAQGVLVLAWDGIITLSLSLLPPTAIKLKWALSVKNYEKRYAYYVMLSHELKDLFEKSHIKTVILKGIGLSSYYPIPCHREGGDLDIYTLSNDTSKLSDGQANELANKLIEEMGIEVDRRDRKNSLFYYKNIPIENHKHFLETDAMKSAIGIDKYLGKVLNPQTITLEKYHCTIDIPSPDFNTIFLAYHAIQHYGNGLCLHHLCDWACLVNHYGLTIPKEITDKQFLSMINLFTDFTNRYLGTHIDVESSDKAMTKLIQEMLRPPYPKDFQGKNKISLILYKTRRFLHYLKLRKETLNEPYLNGIRHSLSFHIRKPEAICQKNTLQGKL